MLPLASSRGPPKMMMGWGPGNQKMMMLGIGGRLWAERGLWRPSTVFRTEVRTAKYLPRGTDQKNVGGRRDCITCAGEAF